MKNTSINNYKITDSTINHVVVKRWNADNNEFEIVTTVEDMLFVTFVDYLDNLSTVADVHWSIDYLNHDYTTATVYVEF